MFEEEIFEGKRFSDLLKEIHTNSKKKDKQINSLIAQLHPLVKNITDATILVPLIKDYIDAGIKNDEAKKTRTYKGVFFKISGNKRKNWF